MGDVSAVEYAEMTATREQNLAVWVACTAINGALFGVFIGQIAFYLRHTFHGDRPFLKGVVLVVTVLNILRILLFASTMWTRFVSAHGALGTFTDPRPWSTYAQLYLNSVAVLVIQSFYAHRIWKLKRSIAATAVLGIFILCTFAGGISLSVYTVLATSTPRLYLGVVHIEKAVNIMFAVTDIALTSALLYVLVRSSANGPSPLVKRLAFYTLSTGVLTCVSALVGIVMIFVQPHSIVATMIWYLAASLYATSLMASLNARENLRTRYNVSTKFGASTGVSTMPRFAPPSMHESMASNFHSVSIIGRSPRSLHVTEAYPADHSEILVESRSSGSDTDVEKHADGEKHDFAESSVDHDTAIAVVDAKDALESSR